MKTRLFLLIFFLFFFLMYPQKAHASKAQESFSIKTKATYVVTEDGKTNVRETITITNKKEFIYTPSYSITLTSGNLSNISVTDADGAIPFTLKETADGAREIEANFEKRVVGIGKSFSFTIAFSSSQFAKKNGNTWKVDIPGLTDPASYDDYMVTLTVPASFGAATIVKPPVTSTSSQVLTFTKDQIGKSGIFILFGDAEYYKSSLSYHIENLNLFPVTTEIALPPNTNYQNVLIKNISPRPENVYIDADGNWLATYSLPPKTKKDITVQAVFKINATPKEVLLTPQEKKKYTSKNTYWESESSSIKSTVANLRTPKDIYDFVVKKLTYSYKKVNSNNPRIGAVKTLANPTYAVCLEFTDLFIALARAKGIPARAVEGYAYTQGDKLRPVSLVKDILHAWPEYYDENKKMWIMVDPTWGNTTQGIDYFTTLDFEHIAFVIKGISSTYPIPAGGYKILDTSKDIEIQFADSREYNQVASSSVLFVPPQFPIPWTQIVGRIIIKNTGNAELPPQKMEVRSSMSDGAYAYSVPAIPPYGTKEIKVDMGVWNPSISQFLTKRDATVTISYNANSISQKFSVSSILLLIIGVIGGVLLVITGILTTIAAKSRRIPFQK